MFRLFKPSGLTWRELLTRVWNAIWEDDVFGQAAKLSFYFLLALFPLLLFITTLFGYFAQSDELRQSLLSYARRVVPSSAFRLVVDTLNQLKAGAGADKLSIGILGTMWAASSGMAAVAEGLNTAYRIKEARPWWKTRLIALGLTIAFVLFTVTALLLILAGGNLGWFLAGRLGMETAFAWVWNLARWPLALCMILIAVDLVYRFAPDLKEWRWHWITPGGLVAVGLWWAASLGFRLYLRFFNSYNATYGSLGAVIILMLWLYISGVAILVGAEVNSEIESARAQAGEADARLPGEKRPGEKRRFDWLRRVRGLRGKNSEPERSPLEG